MIFFLKNKRGGLDVGIRTRHIIQPICLSSRSSKCEFKIIQTITGDTKSTSLNPLYDIGRS